MSVNTNFQISFGAAAGAAGGHLSAEIDGRPEGLNQGRTSFVPGESAGFLVYQSANVRHDAPIPSGGAVASLGARVVEREEDVVFPDTNEASLRIPASAIIQVVWMGRSLGALALDGETTLRASSKGVAVARVKYRANADAYRLSSPLTLGGLTDYSILIFIQGHFR